MEMHQVRYFLAVCDTLNFTRAAERCNVAQPSLTRAIKKLEDELGGLLFRRERRLTHLTDLGQLMRPYLEQALGATEAAQSKARSFGRLETAPLKLGIMCTIGPRRLIALLAKLPEAVPGLELSLHEATLEQLVERLIKGDLDVALLATPWNLPERFDFRPLYKERYVVAFPPGHKFESQNSVRLRDLHQESYLARLSCEYASYVDELAGDQGIEVNVRYRSEREDWVQSLILAGMGCTLMPEYLPIYAALPTRTLTSPDIVREIGLVTIAGRRYSPAVEVLVHMAQRYDWNASYL